MLGISVQRMLLLGVVREGKKKLGWQSNTAIAELCVMMGKEEMELAKSDVLCEKHRFEVHQYNE